ncbi:hypothetical protein HRbin38_00288 [bacterium HR38]|nr:hypothetical protein HRbin38_00288 [bacterium HR38]
MDLAGLVEGFFYFGIWAIVLIETGFLLGFFLLGGTLLITVSFWQQLESWSYPPSFSLCWRAQFSEITSVTTEVACYVLGLKPETS